MQYSGNPRIFQVKQRNFTHNLLYLDLTHLTRGSSPKQRLCLRKQSLYSIPSLYLQCFSIKASTLGSPNSFALAKLVQASLSFFICSWAIPIRR